MNGFFIVLHENTIGTKAFLKKIWSGKRRRSNGFKKIFLNLNKA